MLISMISNLLARYRECCKIYTKEFLQFLACCDLFDPDEKQATRYIHGLKFSVQEHAVLLIAWTVDDVYNLALKVEMLLSLQYRPYSYHSLVNHSCKIRISIFRVIIISVDTIREGIRDKIK